jgi:hypothetical protein
MGIAGRKITTLVSSGALLASLLTGVALVAAPAPEAVAADDAETGCDETYDSAVVGNNPIMFQRITNHIPQGVTVSTLTPGTADKASEIVTRPKPVWLGQKTPYMDGRDTLDYKKWNQRGSEGWPADNWWNSSYSRHHVGCQTNYPFLIGPGDGPARPDLANPRLIDYDGKLFGRNDSWRGKTTWWGVPKRYEQDWVGGSSTWTCRGDVPVPAKVNASTWKFDSVYWKKVNQGSGFFGDNDTDRRDRDAGRAPACENSAFADMSVVPNFRQTFYGSLPDDVRTSNRCDATSTGDIVGCWQRIYAGPWNRSWRTDTNVFAASMLANLRSFTEMSVPAAYRSFDGPRKVTLSWAISNVDIDGVWPDGFDPAEARVPTLGTVSKYTVPGSIQGDATTDRAFKFGGWLDTTPGDKRMRLRLTGSTDGTWAWPTCQDETACKLGQPLPRPQVDIAFRYDLNDFDKLKSSCSGDGLYRTSKFYTREAPCTIGIVPTLFEVSGDSRQNEKFQPKKDEKGKTTSTIDEVKFTPIQSQFWTTTDLKLQQGEPSRDAEGASAIGANVRWDITLSGVISPIEG